ncbi:MAG: tRNA adenosine(34) deaminase TadA [Firmicutes bacterium]|nr:tRNA adenosine(34) deaminase TadA [Bacillota bacterium]
MNSPEHYMNIALALAEDGAAVGEVPVGVVIVKDGEIIGRGRNYVEELKDPTAHAEMVAIRDALKSVGGWRLTNCEMYVTLEPCAMCAGAIVHARLKKVYIGTADPKTGACGSVMNIPADSHLNHHPEVVTGILQEQCSSILKNFFSKLRRTK